MYRLNHFLSPSEICSWFILSFKRFIRFSRFFIVMMLSLFVTERLLTYKSSGKAQWFSGLYFREHSESKFSVFILRKAKGDF